VHGILHLTNDVRRLGNLDSFSAFPYKSNMRIFSKYCRKPDLLLQQFTNRMTELQMHGTNNDHSINSICVSMPYGVNQYRMIHFNGISLSTNLRDSCCILRDGSICVIFNITSDNNIYRLGVKKISNVNNFYDIGLVSTAFQMYKCNTLSIDKFFINLEEVHAKCYKMPFFTTDNDNIENIEITTYIIATIIHSE